MRQATFERQARILMNMHGLDGWTLGFDRAKNRLGGCYNVRKHLTFSKIFVEAATEEYAGTIVLHEIAHALTYIKLGGYEKDRNGGKLIHGPEWQSICLSIGGDGKRCGEIEVEVSYAWVGTCMLCGSTRKQHRAPLVIRCCAECGGDSFRPEAARVWSKNGRRMPLGQMPVRYVRQALSLRERYGRRLALGNI